MVHRRMFLEILAGVGAAPLMAGPPQRERKRHREVPVIKPKRLREGMTVGLIAPASSTFENEDIRFAIDIIRSLGFHCKPGKHLFKRHGYLAGKDEERAEDLNAMFADSEVDAIFALRGGYGTPRILPMLDYTTIKANPKLFIGYSDITALLVAIHQQTGLITFHGPIARQTYSDYTLAEKRKVTMSTEAPIQIGSPPPFETKPGVVESANRLTRIVSGKTRGRLIGGNLSLISMLMGTPFEPDFRDKIVFLEDVGEEPYRVDRMMTQLWLSGKLRQAAGFVIGKFTNVDIDGNSLSLEDIFFERLQLLGKPAIRGMMIGHVRDQTTIPIGIEAELDSDAATLTLLESAVR